MPRGPTSSASQSLVQPLRQLLSSVHVDSNNPASRSLAEELSQLESTDENFHRYIRTVEFVCVCVCVCLCVCHVYDIPLCSYELVRILQRRVHESLDRLIDCKLEEKVLEGDGHSVVAQITDDVFSSPE